jgi:hypothetical protein
MLADGRDMDATRVAEQDPALGLGQGLEEVGGEELVDAGTSALDEAELRPDSSGAFPDAVNKRTFGICSAVRLGSRAKVNMVSTRASSSSVGMGGIVSGSLWYSFPARKG